MPNSISNVGFQTPTDYTSEMGDIQRRRQLAQGLQQQSQTPLETQTAGGWAIPISPFQGIGKMLQAYSGARGQQQATEQEKALGKKYQSDLAQTLMQAQQAGTGTPGSPMPPDELGGGPAQPAQAPDRQRMAALLMQHPGTQQLGLSQMQRDMQMQSFMGAAGQPQQPGGTGQPPQAQGQPAGFGGPAGGVPMAVWLQADPTGGKYIEQLAKDHKETTTPVVNRGFGIGTMQNGKYVPDQASLDQALSMERGKKGVEAQFHVSPVNTTGSPTLMTGQQQIEAATGQPMPGAGPQAPQQAPQQPTQQTPGLPPNVPPEDANAFKYVQENARRGQPVSALGQSQYAGPERRAGLKLQGQGEQKAEVEMGEGLGKRFNAIQDAGFSANQKMQKFERLGGLLSQIETGKLTPAGTELSAWAKAAGFPIGDKVDNAQAAKALSNEMALELRNPAGGAGMPGAMSDSDRNYLQSLIASIDKTPGANKSLMEGMTKLAQRDREVAQLARDYKKKNGSFDDGFYDELAKFSDANPLFKDKPAEGAGAQMFARNPSTNQRIVSTDGGKSWRPAQ